MDANATIPKNSPKPGGGPSAVQANSNKQAVEFFASTISGLYEKDYGDFMRKVVLYIDRLRNDLGGSQNAVLDKMMAYVVYATDFDIENTRIRILRDASDMARRL